MFDDELLKNLQEGKWRKCPKCGCKYAGRPAISRDDNKTEICSSCGRYEALNAKLEHEGKNYRFDYKGNIITIKEEK